MHSSPVDKKNTDIIKTVRYCHLLAITYTFIGATEETSIWFTAWENNTFWLFKPRHTVFTWHSRLPHCLLASKHIKKHFSRKFFKLWRMSWKLIYGHWGPHPPESPSQSLVTNSKQSKQEKNVTGKILVACYKKQHARWTAPPINYIFAVLWDSLNKNVHTSLESQSYLQKPVAKKEIK